MSRRRTLVRGRPNARAAVTRLLEVDAPEVCERLGHVPSALVELRLEENEVLLPVLTAPDELRLARRDRRKRGDAAVIVDRRAGAVARQDEVHIELRRVRRGRALSDHRVTWVGVPPERSDALAHGELLSFRRSLTVLREAHEPDRRRLLPRCDDGRGRIVIGLREDGLVRRDPLDEL